MDIATSVDDVRVAEQRSFMELVEPEMRGAHRLAYGILRNSAEAEDAVQDAVVNAWRNFGRFHRDLPVRPWFYRIVVNECRERRRSRWWSIRAAAAEAHEDAELDSRLDPATADLRRALRRLPHDLRAALVLRYYLDMTFEDVAETLQISPKAAQSRTYRALERLRLTPEVMSHE